MTGKQQDLQLDVGTSKLASLLLLSCHYLFLGPFWVGGDSGLAWAYCGVGSSWCATSTSCLFLICRTTQISLPFILGGFGQVQRRRDVNGASLTAQPFLL